MAAYISSEKHHSKVIFNKQNRQSDWGQRNISYHHCWRGTPQNASSCLFPESAVLEQVWLCQAKHPMLVPDGAKECASLNGKGKKDMDWGKEREDEATAFKKEKKALLLCGRLPLPLRLVSSYMPVYLESN